MSTRIEPVSAQLLAERVAGFVLARAELLTAAAAGGQAAGEQQNGVPVRLLVDGHPSTHPERLADALVVPLEAAGRPAARVSVSDFLRPRSLRLERGREDPDSLLDDWIDVGALNREVLTRVVDRREYLPSLRDPDTDRATRADYLDAAAGTVVVLDGALAIGRGLAVDIAVHLALKPATLRRRTPSGETWAVPAYERYAQEIDGVPDLVVRIDHPDHPALERA
ncbi:uridine kinase [Promicromonospora sp. NPDC023987]|uniref:uridine kinase n=1 Tax=Promicromonospora sp. NPDC023987 TaxID=3155360 RepID=UPI0033C9FF97